MSSFNTQMIRDAKNNIQPHVLKTPLLHSQSLSRLCGCRVYLKMECWQTCGCFKLRGVTNFLSHRMQAVMEAGVVTASSGNHALALAHAAAKLGVPRIRWIGGIAFRENTAAGSKDTFKYQCAW